jgi:hypothetical protein
VTVERGVQRDDRRGHRDLELRQFGSRLLWSLSAVRLCVLELNLADGSTGIEIDSCERPRKPRAHPDLSLSPLPTE